MTLKRNIIANYVGQGWSAVMGLVFVPLYVQYLGIEAFGLIGLFAVMQAWLTLLDMGMTPTLNREMARFTAGEHDPQSIHNLLRSLEIVCTFLAILIVITVWSTAHYLASDWLKADKLPQSVVAEAISVMAWVAALRFVEGIYRGSLFGLQKQVWYNVVNASIATLRHGGVIAILIWISPTVQAFFIWQAIISFFSILLLRWGVRRALPPAPLTPQFTRKSITDIQKFAGGMAAVTFLAILLTQIDKVLLSRLLSLEAFAYYTLATTVASIPYLITSPITTAFFPRLVTLSTQQNQSQLIDTYHQGAQLVTLLVAPIVMLISFFSPNVMFLWSGNVSLTEHTAPILSLLIIGVFLNSLMHMPAQLQLAFGWVSLGIKTNIVAVTLLVPAIFWVVPRYGVMGAAWIWVTLNAGYVLIAMQFMHHRLLKHEKWRWYFMDVFLPTSGSVSVMLLARYFHPIYAQSRWREFLFLCVIWVLALIMSILLSERLRTKLFTIIRNKYFHQKTKNFQI